MATTVAKLQVRRGNQTDLPVLDEGEFGYASDTQRLFIGNAFETFAGTGTASQVLTLAAKTAKSNTITLVVGITGTIKVGYNSEVSLTGGEQKMHHVTLAIGTNVATGYSFDSTTYNTLFLDYSLKQGSLLRVGTLRFITDGTVVSLTDSFDDLTTTLYFTFNAVITSGIIDLQYSQNIASTEFFFQIRTWNTSV